MEDRTYEIEENLAHGCTIILGVVAGFMVFVVFATVCNWLHSF